MMSLIVYEDLIGCVLVVNARGKLTKDDYEMFVHRIEGWMQGRDSVRMLFRMEDFDGWTPGALWEDLKFGVKHRNDIECIAVVGEKTWHKWMATVFTSFTQATIRYFPRGDDERALSWISDRSDSQDENKGAYR